MTATGVMDMLRRFGETTSVKGVGRVLKSRRLIIRCMWLIAVLFGLSFALYNIITLLIRFSHYQTVTNLAYCSDCLPPYPDVTVCNLNSLSLSIEDYDWESPPWTFQEYNGLVTPFKHSKDFKLYMESHLHKQIPDKEWNDLVGKYASITAYFQNFQSVDAETLREELQQRFIQHCSFYDWDMNKQQSVNCSAAAGTIRHLLSPEYLWCYTFTAQELSEQLQSKTRGLEAVLYLDSFGFSQMSLFIPDIIRSQAAGVKVVVHPSGTLPDIKKGFNVGPGQQIDVRLNPVRNERLGSPYGNCTWDAHLPGMPHFPREDNDELRGYLYTQESCLSACFQSNMINKCGCKAGHLAITDHMWRKGDIPFCQKVDVKVGQNVLTQEEVMAIFPKIVESFNQTICSQSLEHSVPACNCSKPCDDISFLYSLFSTPWPHKAYEIAFWNTFIRHNPSINKHFQIYEEMNALLASNDPSNFSVGRKMLDESTLIRDNFLQLNIYFQQADLVTQQEHPAVTRDTLFGSIGGNLNLWIGISFFTVIELVELVFDIITSLITKKQKKIHVKSAPDDQTKNTIM